MTKPPIPTENSKTKGQHTQTPQKEAKGRGKIFVTRKYHSIMIGYNQIQTLLSY